MIILVGDLFLKYFNERHGHTGFAYDEEGNSVQCDRCGMDLVINDDGEYYCAECDEIWDRQKFFDYIGAEPPGPECIVCDNDYPSCQDCPYGYVEDGEWVDEDDDEDE